MINSQRGPWRITAIGPNAIRRSLGVPLVSMVPACEIRFVIIWKIPSQKKG